MKEDLKLRIETFRLIILAFKNMLKSGLITEEDFAVIETIIAKYCELNSSTIFTGISG